MYSSILYKCETIIEVISDLKRGVVDKLKPKDMLKYMRVLSWQCCEQSVLISGSIQIHTLISPLWIASRVNQFCCATECKRYIFWSEYALTSWPLGSISWNPEKKFSSSKLDTALTLFRSFFTKGNIWRRRSIPVKSPSNITMVMSLTCDPGGGKDVMSTSRRSHSLRSKRLWTRSITDIDGSSSASYHLKSDQYHFPCFFVQLLEIHLDKLLL